MNGAAFCFLCGSVNACAGIPVQHGQPGVGVERGRVVEQPVSGCGRQHLREQGFPVTDEMCARLSPIQYDHIDFLGRYAFFRAKVGRLASVPRRRSRSR
ncbi:hypothetical protein [Nonomuraea sp. NPDC049624]|uniref:hypothetical protein n=1 Tax=Nonomuraea sp. NPDC049624 TaxID=3154354 RepID=UPI0034454DD3